MKRALALAAGVVSAACSRGPAPAAFEVVVHASGGSRDAAATDAEIATPLLFALGQRGGGLRGLISRVDGSEVTIVVEPKPGVESGALEVVQHALDDAQPMLPRDLAAPPTFLLHELPEWSIWFAGSASGSADIASSLAQIDGVRRVNACGVADDELVLELDPDRLRAYGLDLEQLRAAVAAVGGRVALLDVPVGAAHVRDVVTVRAPRRTCIVAASSGAAPAVFEVRGRDVHRDELAAAAARAGLQPLDAAEIYVSRVRFEAGGVATLDAARDAAGAAGSAAGVAWAVSETQPDDGVARLAIGLRDHEPDERAVAAARHAIEQTRMRPVIDSLGGAVELEVVLQPADGSQDTANTQALAALAKLRAGGATAGCDGCDDGAGLALRYAVDHERASKLGIDAAAIAHALDALSAGGTWLGDARVVVGVTRDPATRLAALDVAGAGGARVPLAAVAAVTSVAARTYVRIGQLPAATVWVRGESEADVRATLAAVAPAGASIEPRRGFAE